MRKRIFRVQNNKGIVLIVVLIVVFLMAIVSATIFSQSMSQSKTARIQMDDIVADQVTKGAYWQSYSKSIGDPSAAGWTPGAFSSPCSGGGCTVSLNGHTFKVVVSNVLQDITLQTTY